MAAVSRFALDAVRPTFHGGDRVLAETDWESAPELSPAETAAALETLAAWVEEGVAAGRPPKWLAGQAVAAIRMIAVQSRQGAAR